MSRFKGDNELLQKDKEWSRKQRSKSRTCDSTRNRSKSPSPEGERKKLIERWRLNNCDTQDEMQKRLQEISQMNPDDILEEENKFWIRSAPADRYYQPDPQYVLL